MMNWESLFGIANTLALASWAMLIAGPRRAILLRGIRYGVIGLFCLAYTTLVMLYFFRVEGGGFGSLHEVKALFASDPVVLAGWLHYLAFDLFVGLWIAQRADALGVGRLIQAPLLIATFMFGPVGLLVASVIGLSGRRIPAPVE
jgi:hypothetical protein